MSLASCSKGEGVSTDAIQEVRGPVGSQVRSARAERERDIVRSRGVNAAVVVVLHDDIALPKGRDCAHGNAKNGNEKCLFHLLARLLVIGIFSCLQDLTKATLTARPLRCKT